MTVTYPLSLPSTPNFRAITWTPRSVVAVSESPFTLQSQVQEHEGDCWEFTATLPPMARAAADEWVSFLLKLRGRRGTFLFGDPAYSSSRGTITTASVNGASQTGFTLAIDGMDGNAKAGDMFQLGSGSSARLHKVVADLSAASGTLDIWPKLRSSPADNDTLTFTSAKGVFRLLSNSMEWSVDVARHYGLTIAAREVL